MPLFKPLDLTPEEQEQEAIAKAQVLGMFNPLTPDPTAGPGSREIYKQTWLNLAVIALACALFLTNQISEGLYVFSMMTCFVMGAILSGFGLYFARKDHVNSLR